MKKVLSILTIVATLLIANTTCQNKIRLGVRKLKGANIASGGSSFATFMVHDHAYCAGQVIIQASHAPNVKGNAGTVFSLLGNISDKHYDHIPQGNLVIDSFKYAQTMHDEWNTAIDLNTFLSSTQTISIYDTNNVNVDYSVEMYIPNILKGEFPDSLAEDSVITWNSDTNNTQGLVLRIDKGVNELGIHEGGDWKSDLLFIENDDGSYTFTSSDMRFFDSKDEFSKVTLIRGNYSVANHRTRSDSCSFIIMSNLVSVLALR